MGCFTYMELIALPYYPSCSKEYIKIKNRCFITFRKYGIKSSLIAYRFRSSRTCNKCKIESNIENFRTRKNRKISTMCKECRLELRYNIKIPLKTLFGGT